MQTKAPQTTTHGAVVHYCGNGRVEAFERCDDANQVAADGCNENCLPEVVRLLPNGGLTPDRRFECLWDEPYCRSFEPKLTGQGKLVDVANSGDWGVAVLLEEGRVLMLGYEAGPEPEPLPSELQGQVVAITAATPLSGLCVLLNTNDVLCHGMGHGAEGFRAHRGAARLHWEPVLLARHDRSIREISGGMSFGCAVFDTGALQCWGGVQKPGVARDVVLGTRKVKSASVARAHACALFDDGGVACWGAGSHGELGYAAPALNRCGGAMTDDLYGFGMVYYCNWHPPDRNLPLPDAATQVFTRQLASCALLRNGELWCWGDVSGLVFKGGEANLGGGWAQRRTERLDSLGVPVRKPGDASTLPSHPVQLPVDCKVSAFSLQPGGTYCALCDNGCLQCWGSGSGLTPTTLKPTGVGEHALATCTPPADLVSQAVLMSRREHSGLDPLMQSEQP